MWDRVKADLEANIFVKRHLSCCTQRVYKDVNSLVQTYALYSYKIDTWVSFRIAINSSKYIVCWTYLVLGVQNYLGKTRIASRDILKIVSYLVHNDCLL